MRIALVSYEFVGVPGGGGIGTYIRNAARMLAERGHEVHVVTAAPARDGAELFHIHAVEATRESFPVAAGECFDSLSGQMAFDVVEGAEYFAETSSIRRNHPNVPVLVKLHTPTYLINRLHNSSISRSRELRFMFGAIRRGQLPRRLRRPALQATDPEWLTTLDADLVVGPSQAILDLVGRDWGIDQSRRLCVPNVFVASEPLLAADPFSHSNRVLYVGRLEVRKGVLDLASAIPLVCHAMPGVRFTIIGRSLPMPASTRDVKSEMITRIGSWVSNVEFVDALPHSTILERYAESDLCVLPSIWENFPNVCMEAMAAARGVIGSSAGGMAEIIEAGRSGLLVPPRSPRAIARAILSLLSDPARRIAMGRAARERVLSAYAPETVGPLQEESYRRAIARAARRRAESAG